MKSLRWLLLALVASVAFIVPRTSKADEASPRATFALIIGSNQSVDANLAPLRYADDDAARYLDLFRLLGARTYLLTRLDDNTKRLHPQAAAEATDPNHVHYEASVAQLTADVTQASQRGVETIVYFVYAGHGNVENGQGYITLEDQRLTGNDLAATFAKIPATRIHVIADACASYFLVYSRGPGGERRPLDSMGLAPALANDARIGLLLSTSSARESHEWDAFQSGVFSHEVRSGLYGAADADGDGQVSYREIAAFVTRANASVPNERYRPDIHARAPRGGDTLLDIRKANGRRIEIDGRHAGHYYLEDARGVRIADIHNAKGQSLSLMRPAPNGRVFLRNVDDDREVVIEARPDVVSISNIPDQAPRVASRGAAHEAFNSLFMLPFDEDVVAAYPVIMCIPGEPPRAPVAIQDPLEGDRYSTRASWRTPVGATLLGVGVVSLGIGAFMTAKAHGHTSIGSQYTIAHEQDVADTQQNIATGFYLASIASVAVALPILLMPNSRRAAALKNVQATALPNGGYVGYGHSF